MRRLTTLVVTAVIAFVTASSASAQTLQWAKGLAGGPANIYHLEVGGTGAVYVTGNFFGTSDFNPGSGVANLTSVGTADCFVAKYDASGNYLWARRIGGSDMEYTYGLAVDSAGALYVGGYFRGAVSFDASTTLTSSGSYGNLFIAKYDTSGTLVWARAMVGTGNGYLRGLRLDSAGNVIITGTFTGTLDFNPSTTTSNLTSSTNFNLFIAKYTSAGNLTWAKMIDSTDGIYFPSLALDASNNILVSAGFSGTLDANPDSGTAYVTGTPDSTGPTSLFIGKYTSSGTYVWGRGIVGAGNDDLAVGSGIAVDGSGNVVVTGHFSGAVNFGSTSLTGFGDWDAFVAKYSSTNAALWALQLGGGGAETGSSVVVDGSGSIYVLGSYYDSGDYHPASGTTVTLTHLGTAGYTADAFLSKFGSDGSYQWVYALNSSADDFMKDLTLDGSNNLYLGGFTHGTVDFDVGAGTAYVASSSVAAKYSVGSTSGGTGLVPTMTSATTPSGAVTSSGVYGSGYEPWKVFDGVISSLWLSNSSTSSVWLDYEWGGGTSRTVTSYEIRYNNGSCCEQRGPKNWTLLGWNGASWVTVDSVTGQTGWYANPNRTFTVDSPGSYSKYRLNITADNYNDPTYPITLVSIATLQFY